MAKKPRLKKIEESDTGLNRTFEDTLTKEILTRGQVADRIKQGLYPGYHVMVDSKGRRIPRSNPDDSKNNNLD